MPDDRTGGGGGGGSDEPLRVTYQSQVSRTVGQPPEDTVVTCAGGIQIQAPGVTNGE